MSNLTIQLDTNALRDATVQAMLGVLTPEVKDKIMENAVRSILTPSTNSWDRGRSVLERAFEEAVQQIARNEAKRIVEEDSVLQLRLRELLRNTADRILNTDLDRLAVRLSDAFVSSMRRED